MKKLLYYAYLFTLFGYSYCTVEIIWRGRTHYSMFFAGGIIGLLFVALSIKTKKAPLFKKCLLGTMIITVVELIFGGIFNVKYNMNVWNYSSLPFNFMGQICLPYSILWFGLCFIIFKWIIKDDFYNRTF